MNGAFIREVMNNLIEQQLLLTHTAFIGKVVSVKASRSTVQPLTYAKDAKGEPYEQPLVVDAPKLAGLEIEPGAVVLCVVCERDISGAIEGRLSMPARRRHSLADSVIVGVLEGYERV